MKRTVELISQLLLAFPQLLLSPAHQYWIDNLVGPTFSLAGNRLFKRHRNCFQAHASSFGDVVQQLKAVPHPVRSFL